MWLDKASKEYLYVNNTAHFSSGEKGSLEGKRIKKDYQTLKILPFTVVKVDQCKMNRFLAARMEWKL